MRCVAVVLSAIALSTGCGDDSVPADTGVVDAGGDATDVGVMLPPAPTAPTPPTLPTLTPCADGFEEEVVGDAVELTICSPAPFATCPDGEHLFVTGCRTVGSACPASRFADATGVVIPIYVDPTAAPGGDGTEASPYASLAEALAIAPDGATLMLSVGEHLGNVVIDSPVTLKGACPTATTITSVTDGGTNLRTEADDVHIEGLTVTGDAIGIRVVAGSTTSTGVVVDGATVVGVLAEGGTLTIDDLAVVDTRPGPGGLGLGLIALGTGRIDAERLSLARNHSFGAGANSGGELTMVGARITETLAVGAEDLGMGISVAGGATVQCRDCMIELSTGVAVHVVGMGSTAGLSDTRVDRTLGAGADGTAISILAAELSSIQLTRTAITRSNLAGVTVGSGASATLADVIIFETAREAGFIGYARTNTEAERLAISSTGGLGLQLSDPGATASLTDLTIASTRPRDSDGLGGRGLETGFEASLTLERARLVDNYEVSLLIDHGARVTARDLSIEDTRPKAGIGRAINIQGAATFDGDRVDISDSSEVGVFVYDVATAVTMRSLRIVDTLPRDCPDGSCLPGGGMGIVVMDDATFDAADFLLARNALAGLQLAGASVTWTDGVVRDHPIGVNIQMARVDASSLTDNVVYLDNGQNLDTTELPTPAPAVGSAP